MTAPKMTMPSQFEIRKPQAIHDPVEKRMGQQTTQRRVGNAGVQKLLGMGFLAEMEMRRQSVFENMHDEVTHQNPGGGASPCMRSKLSGIITVIVVASMKPEPKAMKEARKLRRQGQAATMPPPKHIGQPGDQSLTRG